MKKKLVLASSACLVASAMALSGCSGSSKPAETSAAAEKSEAAADTTTAAAESGSSDTMHLSFYYPVNVGGDAAKLIEKICADFNAENPDIVVDPVYTGNYDDTVTKIQTAIQGGTPPDVFVSLATQRFTMASTGMAMPLDDLIAADGDEGKAYIDDFLSGFMEDSYVDGKIYSIPFQRSTEILFYNKDAFKEVGLDPEKAPATWDELEQYAEQIVEKTGKYGFDMAVKETTPMWCIMLWGNGGDFIKDGKAVFNSPENVETITRWAENIRDKKFGPEVLTGGEIDKLFESQKLAMYFCGPWATTGFKNAGIDFGVAQAPKGPEQQVTQANGVGMFLTASSKNKEEVYDFFKYWNSVDTQVEWCLGTGFPPARTDIADDARLNENPYIKEFAKPANESQMYLQQLTNFADIENQAITPAFEKILLQNADVKESLDEANDIIQSMLE